MILDNFIRDHSAGKRDRGINSSSSRGRSPREEEGEALRLHWTVGEAHCSMESQEICSVITVFKWVENSPALLYMFVKTLKIGYLENHLLDNIFAWNFAVFAFSTCLGGVQNFKSSSFKVFP